MGKYSYTPKGVCSRQFNFEIEDGIIKSFEAIGGCNGNLKGIGCLLKGRSVDEVIDTLTGVTCGNKPTSCPDQIACALKAYRADHFLGALKEIERRAENNILVFSDVLTERLEVIAQNMVGKSISDNDYLKLLELYYKKFSKDENKQAMLFCLLRMQEVVFYKEHKENQDDLSKMEFNEEYDSITKAFLFRKRVLLIRLH